MTNIDLHSIPAPVDKAGAVMVVTPEVLIKMGGSAGVMCIGIYYVLAGKRDQEVGKMVIGAILIMASFFLFF